ncbi:MAG: hypothetical protein UDP20_04335 [Prevotella sp.]|nr:hypothetical protein [Prevotella sp.]
MQTEKEEFYHLINFSIMAILKATVRFKNKSGLYPVYVRFTQVKQVSYVKTSLMVNEKGLNSKKEIIDPFVIQQTSIIIENYYKQLNQVDTSNWSIQEIVKYVTEFNTDFIFLGICQKTYLQIDKSRTGTHLS